MSGLGIAVSTVALKSARFDESLCSTSSCDVVVPRRFLFSVFSVAEKRLNTEITETLRDLSVEALEEQRTRRSSFWLRHVCETVVSCGNPLALSSLLPFQERA